MGKRSAIITILIVSILGVLFSGYLTYLELFKKICAFGYCVTVNGIPTCLYGFILFFIILIASILGLASRR